MSSQRRLRLLVLALALAVSASLTAVASRDTNAFFADVHVGEVGGTLGSLAVQCPYRLEPGTSKARHWNRRNFQNPRVLPIALQDSNEALYLDFGEEMPGNGNASPDVFRFVSLVADSRTVSFSVSGEMAAFVTEVRLKDGSAVLTGRAMASVFVKIHVPDDAQPGTYSGTLTVHVDGWGVDTSLPMVITLRSAPQVTTTPTTTPSASPTPEPASTPSEGPTSLPSEAPSPTPSTDPTAMSRPTPPATPTAGPVAAVSSMPTSILASEHDSEGGSRV